MVKFTAGHVADLCSGSTCSLVAPAFRGGLCGTRSKRSQSDCRIPCRAGCRGGFERKSDIGLEEGDRVRRNRRRIHPGRGRHGESGLVDASDQRASGHIGSRTTPMRSVRECGLRPRCPPGTRPTGLRRVGGSTARAGDAGRGRTRPTPRNPPHGRVDVWSSSRRATRRCSAMWPVPMPKPRRLRPNVTCLQNQLEAAQHNLSLLTDRLQEPRRPQRQGCGAPGARRAVAAQPAASPPSSEGDDFRAGHLNLERQARFRDVVDIASTGPRRPSAETDCSPGSPHSASGIPRPIASRDEIRDLCQDVVA